MHQNKEHGHPNQAVELKQCNHNHGHHNEGNYQGYVDSESHEQYEEEPYKGLSQDSRMGFIRKVYLILASQMVVTAALVILALTSASFNMFIKTSPGFFLLMMFTYIICMYTLFCYPSIARTTPTKYIVMLIFTLSMAYVTSAMTVYVAVKTVILSAILTAVLVLALTAYAFTTKTDFTAMGAGLFMLGALLSFGSLIAWLIGSSFMHFIIAILTVALFGAYLIYDTQLIIGGEGRHSAYEIDDYILAALNIYLDIITIFIQLLQIIGFKNN